MVAVELAHFYCWHCLGLLEQRHSVVKIDGVPRCICPDCRTDCKPVSCLVCLDSGETDALGEEIPCHRGCNKRGIPLDTVTGEAYSLEESAKGDE